MTMKQLSHFARRVVEIADDLGISHKGRAHDNDVVAVADLVGLLKSIKSDEAVALLATVTRNDRRAAL
jgi:2-phospho-L-lactate transferase/gluconeogenesis factor (CofD/UPF0052 family)